MKRSPRKLPAKKLLTSLAVLSALGITGYKANQLAADPTEEKECPPMFAAPGTTSIEVDVTTLPGSEQLTWEQTGGTINDASCLNRTPIAGIVRVTTVDEIQEAITFARENNLKISLAGVKHSMGGQAFFKNAVVLDMTHFNAMTLDEDNKRLTVQSGATWHDIQNFLHPRFAVKAMQSTDIFTVGGSISVNAHGMDHQAGSVGSTIRAMRVMLTSGEIVTASPTENAELFDLVVGGYGLFGIILDVELEITENVVYETGRRYTDYQSFPALFADELLPDPRLGLFYGHLSTGPGSLLDEMILYTYMQVDAPDAEIPPLEEVSATRLRRFVLNFSKLGDIPMSFKWWAEKVIEPRMEACTVRQPASVSRNQAMAEGEACLVSRNEPMHDSVKYLLNDFSHETDILHEYFIPRGQFVAFVDGLREIVQKNDVNLLNASVRVVHPERNFLNYAPEDMFSIVLYINQPTSPEGNAKMGEVTRALIDLTIELGGRFFLPYQLHYTPEQLVKSYPEIPAFFAAKGKYDPDGLLTNTFYEKYGK
jgi:FAD/FMN-containing dehydrogenase